MSRAPRGSEFRARAPWLAVVAGVFAADQAVKLAVEARLALHESFDVIPGFFRLEHVLNRGGVWGMGGDASPALRTVVFLALPVLITGLAVWYSLQIPVRERLRHAAIALVVGGALGNLVDRLRLGAVIDYVVLHAGRWEWPAFNVADSAICVGVGLLAVTTLLEKEEAPAGRADASP